MFKEHEKHFRKQLFSPPNVSTFIADGWMSALRELSGAVLFMALVKVRSRTILKAIGINFKRYYAWFLFFLEFPFPGRVLRTRKVHRIRRQGYP